MNLTGCKAAHLLLDWLMSVAMLLEWLDDGRLTCRMAVRDCLGITRIADCCKAGGLLDLAGWAFGQAKMAAKSDCLVTLLPV